MHLLFAPEGSTTVSVIHFLQLENDVTPEMMEKRMAA